MRLRTLVMPVLPVTLAGVLLGLQDGARGGRSGRPESAGQNRFGLSQPLPRTSGAVRLATYNVLNLFDDVDDPSLQGEFDDIKFTTPADQLANVAAAIRRIDADVLALEEVESKDALIWFRDRYLADMGYKHVSSIDAGYYRGVECSLLSRFKITAERVWPDETLDDVRRDGFGWASRPANAPQPLMFQRSPLMVDVEIRPDYMLTLFVVHHKSGAEFDYQREAEALQIVEYLTELRRQNPSRNVIVLGDFNCAPWDKSLRVYLESGLIDTLAHRTTHRDDPESRFFKTHESDKVLDYILLSSAAHRELVIGSPHVHGTSAPPPGYDYRTDPRPSQCASDHYPVIIELMPEDLP